MKVLLISLSNNYDHQMSLYSLYESIKTRGVEVFTIGINNPKYSINFSLNNIFVDAPQKPGICRDTFKIKKINKIVKIINELNFDIVYFESLHIWNLFLMKKLKKKVKIVHSIHDVIPHEGKNSIILRIFNKILFEKADSIVVRSKSAYDFCKNKKKILFRKISYIPLGRKWKKFVPCSNTKKVLFFGRMTKYKGLDNLLDICKEMNTVNFLIVGKPLEKADSVLLGSLKQYPNVFVNDKYVTEDEMIDYFTESDCVILPYISATQSGVAVDSYCLSRPCIAFDVGGIHEQIIDGVTGFLVENDIAFFRDKIEHYLNFNVDEKNKMCFAAYSFGKNNFSSDAIADKFIALFNKIIGGLINDNHKDTI